MLQPGLILPWELVLKLYKLPYLYTALVLKSLSIFNRIFGMKALIIPQVADSDLFSAHQTCSVFTASVHSPTHGQLSH